MSTLVSLPLDLKTTQEINTIPFPQFLSCKLGLGLNAKAIHEERDTAGCMHRTVFLPRTAARWNQAVLQEAIWEAVTPASEPVTSDDQTNFIRKPMNAKYCHRVCRARAPISPKENRAAWYPEALCSHQPHPTGATGLLHSRSIWIHDGPDVCNSTSSSRGVWRLFVLLFWQVIQGALLIWHVRSTIKQRAPVNSLLQLGKLNAITRVFVTDLQIPASNLPSDGCYKVKSQGHAFPGNYLLPAIIVRVLRFSLFWVEKTRQLR